MTMVPFQSKPQTWASATSVRGNQRHQHVEVLVFERILPLSEPQNCLEETLLTIYGEYIWAETFPQVTQEMVCTKPGSERAYRLW